MRNFLAATFAILTFASVALSTAQAGPNSPNERARDAACATGCGGG
jgi:hypothetical protein